MIFLGTFSSALVAWNKSNFRLFQSNWTSIDHYWNEMSRERWPCIMFSFWFLTYYEARGKFAHPFGNGEKKSASKWLFSSKPDRLWFRIDTPGFKLVFECVQKVKKRCFVFEKWGLRTSTLFFVSDFFFKFETSSLSRLNRLKNHLKSKRIHWNQSRWGLGKKSCLLADFSTFSQRVASVCMHLTSFTSEDIFVSGVYYLINFFRPAECHRITLQPNSNKPKNQPGNLFDQGATDEASCWRISIAVS